MTEHPAGSLNGLLGYLANTRAPVVVVGGMAVIVHGYVRATGDVDVVIAEGPETARWLRRIVVDLDVSEDRNAQPLNLELLDGTRNVGLQTRYGLLDVLIEGASPLRYDELVEGGLTVDFADGALTIIGLAHLRLMKELAGRLQDRLDLEHLRDVHGTLPAPPTAAD